MYNLATSYLQKHPRYPLVHEIRPHAPVIHQTLITAMKQLMIEMN